AAPEFHPPAAVVPDPNRQAVDAFVRGRAIKPMWDQVENWKQLPAPAKRAVVRVLAQRLGEDRYIGFTQVADLHVLSRVNAGKMPFQGHGLFFEQDVFLVNGRCAWAIEELLGCRLPVFEERMGAAALQKQAERARAVIREQFMAAKPS